MLIGPLGAYKRFFWSGRSGQLAAFAKRSHTGAAADRLLTAWCHILKHAGGGQLIRVLDRDEMAAEGGEEHDGVLAYLGNDGRRMDYPTDLRHGWPIGSGAVESACKTVVNQRLCLGRMRWGEDESDAVAHLRALCPSDADQWEAFWAMAA
jgi:hypothetical protein